MANNILEADLLDIGYGMPVHLSSTFDGRPPLPHLVPAADPGAPFFRTATEDNPTLTIDLLSVRVVQRIRIFNNETEAERNVPLRVSVSSDAETWSDVLLAPADFSSQPPLAIQFRYFVRCRYVRLRAEARTSLRLHYVEVAAPLPHEYLGRLHNVRATAADVLADYAHHDSYGFTWTFTCTLGMILNARLLGVTIDRIDYRLCLHEFKDEPGADAYPALFEPKPRTAAALPASLPAFERHGTYATYALDVLHAYARLYFEPNAAVRAYAAGLAARYRLDLANTAVLLYRGTDKVIEIAPVPPERYAAVARALQAREPGLAVLCQTDQTQALETMLAECPGATCFAELPTTGGAQAIHNLDVGAEFGLAKSEMALRLLAMTILVAQAKYVVLHTGNLAAWVALYRGHAGGMYQFCGDGQLRGPAGTLVTPALEEA